MLSQLKTLGPYIRRHRLAYALGFTAIGISSAFRLWIPKLVGEGFNSLDEAYKQSNVEAAEVRDTIMALGLLIVGSAFAGGVTRYISRVTILGSCRRIGHELRQVIFDHLLRLAPSFYVRNPTGQIMSRAVNDLQNVQSLTGPVALYLVETGVMYVIGPAMMLSLSPRLTLLGLLPFPFFLYAARKLAVRIQAGTRAAQNSLGELSAKVDESLSGQLVIKTLTLEDFDFGRFREHCREYRKLNLGVTRYRALLIPMMMSLPAISTVTLLVFGRSAIQSGEIGIGDLVALLLYLQLFAGPTRTLGFVISSLRRGTSALERVQEILDSEVAIEDPKDPLDPARNSGPCEVEVRNLSVVHAPLDMQPHLTGSLPAKEATEEHRERRVLDQVSFKLPAGQTLGVVGHTGSGKTTLVRALARLLEVPRDTIFVDGVDMTRLRLQDIRECIGFVPQEAFLFSATLADNIALGNKNASREAIEKAVEMAQLGGDLAQLPLGLDTIVGERGVLLSGGQRQRTALARVLLMSPRLLILDDTLSAVDTNTADKILEVLKPFASQRTTIMAAHRLSSLQDADRIIVLDEGRIVEEGTHPELLERGGIYSDLWRRQAKQSASVGPTTQLDGKKEIEGEGHNE